MKKTMKFLMVFLLSTTALTFLGCEKEKAIPKDNLPESAKTFLSTHFTGQSVSNVIKDEEDKTITYEVMLTNGINVDFDKNGNCISIDGHGNKLPDSVILPIMLTYIQANYPNYFVTDWGLESFGQKVELSNGIELGFDSSGNFLYVLD